MARRPAPGARDRILDAAARLFRRDGAWAVGMQQIIDECGCGKNLLYREFPSKDDLVAAYLERCQEEWTAIMEAAMQPVAGDPAAQLVALVRAAAREASAPDFRGCPFRSTRTVFPDPAHPAHQVAVRHLAGVRARLRRVATRARLRTPGTVADRIMIILDGLYGSGATRGARGSAATAVAFAEDVVRAATRSPATRMLRK